MVAAVSNFIVEQNATFKQRLVWRDRMKKPINLTGYTARMQIRSAIGAGASVIADLTTANGGIVLGGINGTIDIIISSTATAAMSFTSAFYDFLMIAPDGTGQRLLQGKITLSQGVTQ
jgi:hypothetical protein